MRFNLRHLVFFSSCFLSAVSPGLATPANVWHIPDNLELNSGTTHMRDPEFEISNSASSATTITVYQGIYKGIGENEVNGGVVYYKGQSQTSWSSAPLNFF